MNLIFRLIGALASTAVASSAPDAKPEPLPTQHVQLTDSGAWCWFSEPKAVFRSDPHRQLITGWVSNRGDIVVGAFDFSSQKTTLHTLHEALQKDDHDNPAFAVLPDGRIAVFYAKHGGDALYLRVSARPEDVTEWLPAQTLRLNNPELLARFGHDRYTYANPWIIREEGNRLYLFWRGAGFKPNVSWSDDGGATWQPSRMVVCPLPFDVRQRPYAKYYSNGRDRIHILFTDGHPRNEPFNSVYYACYRAGAFWRADDAKICDMDSLPFEPKAASLVYDAHSTGARAWVWDICEDELGRPVAVYAVFPSETDHRYRYARFDGRKWTDHEITAAGRWFPQTPSGEDEREPHYSAGITLDVRDVGAVYLSRSVNGRFEIERWMTPDQGQTWRREPITRSSPHDNVRPYVPRYLPRDEEPVLLWMENKRYLHYTDFDCNIRLCLPPSY